MNVQVHHVIVHTPEQVAEIVDAARQVADDSPASSHSWNVIFEQACALLGARHSIVLTPQAAPMTLEQLGLNGRKP